MRSSWQLALISLAGRRARTALMIGAVAIAAAIIAAMSSAFATVKGNLEGAFERAIGASDARINHAFNGWFSVDILDQVRAWPQVKLATGRIATALTLTFADGRVDSQTTRPIRVTCRAIGIDFTIDQQFHETEFRAGGWPQTAREIVLDPEAAQQLNAAVGDVLRIDRTDPPRDFVVSGIYDRLMIPTFSQPTIRMDVETLAEIDGRAGELSWIMILLHDDVDVEAFCERYGGTLPETLILEPADTMRAGFDQQAAATDIGLIIATMLSFLSAAFIIVTGMTAGVTEQQRMFAIYRCIGAERKQVFIGQVCTGAVVGVFGAVIGIPLGVALVALLARWFSDMLHDGLHIDWFGLALAAFGALACSIGGALYPAWEASRIAPLQAFTLRARPLRRWTLVLTGLLGAVMVAAGPIVDQLIQGPETRFWAYVWFGWPTMFVGYFLLAVPLFAILAFVFARPLSKLLRLPADLLALSMSRSPFRDGFTAGAMMVGMALYTVTWCGATAIMNNWLQQIRFADAFAFRLSGIPEDVRQRITALPCIEDSSSLGIVSLRVIGKQVIGLEGLHAQTLLGFGFDPDTIFKFNSFQWHAGDPEHAAARLKQGDAIVVADEFLKERNLGVGDVLTLGRGRIQQDFEIVGVVASVGLEQASQMFGMRNAWTEQELRSVFLDRRVLTDVFDSPDVLLMQLMLNDECTDDEIAEQIAEIAPGVEFRSARALLDIFRELVNTILTVYSVVAFGALLLACLGVGNIMAANIHERRYEYGVLRAIGTRRESIAGLILAEAALLALAGCIVGTLAGVQGSALEMTFHRDLLGLPVSLSVPVLQILLGWLVVFTLAIAVCWPAARSIVRRSPSDLLSSGKDE